LLHLDAAHRQRRAGRPHCAEAFPLRLGLAQHLEVDLDAVHLLHAADVGMAELFERVEERARALHTGGRIDDLVAVDVTAAALELVLRPERDLRHAEGREALRLWWHDGIFLPEGLRRKT